MSKKPIRPKYEPPHSRDLSAFSVTGIEPLGICQSGTKPFTRCEAGNIVDDGTPGECAVGNYVAGWPSCAVGSNAIVGCSVGGAAG